MQVSNQKEPWRESLFNFCASPGICCKGAFCLACLFGENAARINNDSCGGYCCIYTILSPFYACGLTHMGIRAKIREKYGLEEEPSDFVAACLLSPLAVCQEAREIESRERMPGKTIQTNQPLNNFGVSSDTEAGSSHAS